ncbi:MAG TPA: phosphate ABC transporter substrate-binding protein, partial [Armatimonadetes bacterium]|nr:phosphate ABC transporter substrate-binding protein [Armatimonadota bacterium]
MMLISLSATAVARGGRITIKGSDTMVILNQRWAEEYMRTHRGIIVQVTGGGSGTGIAALLNGTTDICAASRPLKAREIKMLKRRFKRPPVKFAVAMDGIAIYVNHANPIKVLTLEQIRLIYTGRLNNWRYVGGPNRKIVRYGRENNSGTYAFLKEHVLRGADYANDCQAMPGTAAVVNAVAKDKWAIGYGGIGYAKGVKIVAVKKNAKSP